MKKFDVIYVGLLLVGAFWAFVINSANDEPIDRVQPCDLLDIVSQTDKYMTTDELARRLMSDDPTLALIDLRSKTEYDKYSLTGATNIPLENVLDDEYVDIINQDIQTVVFYGNSSDLAAKAWMLTKRLGYQNSYILKGGLNRWVETILRPREPQETASRVEFERYSFRKAASSYFGGGSALGESTTTKRLSAPIKRKKKSAAGGGCD
ncbi:MAG: rhodanese-like domain-containing protein [Bacteroidales bacterium]|nr:rhodanese-like domain-containing protein [Bacteroidales bacterium]